MEYVLYVCSLSRLVLFVLKGSVYTECWDYQAYVCGAKSNISVLKVLGSFDPGEWLKLVFPESSRCGWLLSDSLLDVQHGLLWFCFWRISNTKWGIRSVAQYAWQKLDFECRQHFFYLDIHSRFYCHTCSRQGKIVRTLLSTESIAVAAAMLKAVQTSLSWCFSC